MKENILFLREARIPFDCFVENNSLSLINFKVIIVNLSFNFCFSTIINLKFRFSSEFSLNKNYFIVIGWKGVVVCAMGSSFIT